jgi:hypothetical protein
MKWKHLLSLPDLARFFRLTPPSPAPLVNQREFTRVPLAVEADILSGDIPIVSGRTKDISMKGLYLLSNEPLSVGRDYHIVLLLSGRGPSASLTPLMFGIQANGRIVRVTEAGLGIEFTEIIGQDSFEHLQHLLLHHSQQRPEAEQVRQELQRASWSQSTRIIRPFDDGSPLSATRFSLKRGGAQPETAIELSPGCVILLQ